MILSFQFHVFQELTYSLSLVRKSHFHFQLQTTLIPRTQIMKDGGSVYSYGIGKAGQLGFGDAEKNVTALKRLSFFAGIVIVSVHCGFAQSAAISSS